jgi:hypothetical protein
LRCSDVSFIGDLHSTGIGFKSSFFGRGALREEGAIRKPECAICYKTVANWRALPDERVIGE